MARSSIPVYSICSLSEKPLAANDILADRFAHYLGEHKDLRFPHKHSFYHLVYFTKGSGSHSIDFVDFNVQPGQVYFMVPGQVHSWNFKGTPEGYIINFSAGYLNALLANTRYLEQFSFFSGRAAAQVIQLPVSTRPNITHIFENIMSEYNADDTGKDDMIRTAIVQLLLHVERQTNTAKNPQHAHYNSVLLRNFQQLIELHFKEKKLTRDYAAMLYVTPNHLNALCKDIQGRPAGELIRDRILLEAKRLLINASLSISEIAATLDFDDNSYFTKFFKKYEGVTPQVFRQQLLKN